MKSANSWATSAAQGTKCTVQLKTNENDPENQVQCMISMTEDQCNVNQSVPSRRSCISPVQNTRNPSPTKFIHSLSRVQGKPMIKTKSRLESQRQLMTARGLKKLIKREKEQVFLAVVRCIGRPKIVNAAIHPESQGLTEKKKRELMKASGPKKEFLSVKEREEEILERMQPEFRGKLREIVDEYRDVFPEKLPKGRPPKREIEHSIEIDPEAQPPNRAPYRLGPADQDELEAQIRDLVAQGFIRPSSSPYGAPVLFVPKKDGRWRMCIDYHALNKQTVKDRFPLPRIDSLMERLGQARVFSKLDLASGYHQIAVKEEHIQKTAFRTQQGHWEFIVMPFGLCNAPASFQRLMNKVFTGTIGDFVLVYLDDILVFSRTIEEHWEHLRQALQRLRKAKLYGRLHKCEFLKDKVDYLGFEVSSQGVHASPDKVRAVVEWPRPKDVHDVRSFLGLASYYRKFIRGFSEIARPLTDLTRAAKAFDWKEPQQSAFIRLKMALATAPILLLPDFELPFVITTDASEAAVGAILEQNQGRGLQPVAFASRKLNSTEMRYSAYERELLGIVWALGQWRHYIEQSPHKVVIQADHAPLRFLPNQTSVNTRVWKWINVMQGYDLDIRHIPGKKNPADSLSRQLREDALGRKSQVCKEHEQWINELRVPAGASEEQIQEALSKLFQQSQKFTDSVDRDQRGQDQIRLEQRIREQYQTERAEHTRSTTAGNSVQSILYSIKEDQDQAQYNFVQDQAVFLVQRATVTLQPDLKQQINSLLMNEEPYSTILEEINSTSSREVSRGRLKYRRRNGLLCIHQEDQSEDVEYWRIVIPDDDTDCKNKILKELHSVPYSGHPGVVVILCLIS